MVLSAEMGRWCRGEGQGSEPDVTLPENRHVRSSGLSRAPSLAHQPKWSRCTLTSHLALASGWGPQYSPGPRPGEGKATMDSPFPVEETEAQTLLQEALQRTAVVHWQRPTARFQLTGLWHDSALYDERPMREGFQWCPQLP